MYVPKQLYMSVFISRENTIKSSNLVYFYNKTLTSLFHLPNMKMSPLRCRGCIVYACSI